MGRCAPRSWGGRGEPVAVEHLLVALLDQADPGVVEVMRRAGVDANQARVVALRRIGARVDEPKVARPQLTAAGTMDRPPLPLSQLPAEAWAALQARRSRLPLSRLHRESDWFAILSNETRAVDKLVKRFDMDEDHGCSLQRHHDDAVELRFRHPLLAGWGCWFGNRRVELRAAWLRLTAAH
jgi:hypothetical protein